MIHLDLRKASNHFAKCCFDAILSKWYFMAFDAHSHDGLMWVSTWRFGRLEFQISSCRDYVDNDLSLAIIVI